MHLLSLLQQGKSTYAQSRHTCKNHQAHHTHNGRNFENVANNDFGTVLEYVLDETDNEDDNKNVAAEKYREMATSHATHTYPPYPSILNYLRRSFKATPSVFLPATNKYIEQGVLRI